ncbi:energy transducer TonB [Thalassovita sp.]|uniref:energy transducer TonB family protein n=1 Tax=Thalassovita sp. TaxID=1979401 RepID=UPI0029DE90B7|nr:energy transducer TonB [Thalassovita sp.]
MKRPFEAALFLGAAAGLHLLALSFVTAPSGAAGAAGDGGQDRLTLTATSASMAALVRKWETPPQVTPAIAAPLPPASDRTPPRATDSPTAPRPSQPGLSLPQPDSATPPTLDTAPATPQPPEPPKTAAPKPPAPAPSPKQTAAGKGKSGAAGQSNAPQASLSPAQTRSLTAQWGAQILTRIERRKRYPSAARGRSGTVGLQLSVAADGRLLGVSVRRPSGNTALDRAAVQAVQRAGRFPAAPQGLSGASHGFNLSIRFDG